MTFAQKNKITRRQRPALSEMPFVQLVASVPELREARQKYTSVAPAKRRAAAEWAYESGIAQDLFTSALVHAVEGDDRGADFEYGVGALAIDPRFAPALLTVGCLEYQYKRVHAAMELLMVLTTLPESEPNLAEIIDNAGTFLLDENDSHNAARLFRAATHAYPEVCEYWSGLSYCLGKQGEMDEVVTSARKALALKENDPHVLNDLGWTLLLAELYDEARTVFERAVALAPKGYDLPRNNLKELEERLRLKPGASPSQ